VPAATYVPQTGSWWSSVEADAPPGGAALAGPVLRGPFVPRKARTTAWITDLIAETATKNRSIRKR